MTLDVARMVAVMVTACRDWSLGYDQGNRQDIRDGGECDCSSLVLWAIRAGGGDTGRATYTGNMRAELTSRGWTIVARQPQSSAGLRAGDILLNDSNHVAMMVAPTHLGQASIDERGRISGGMSGDQTGRETNVNAFYVYPWGGWSVVLRYVGGATDPDGWEPDFEGSTRWNPNAYDASYVREVQTRLVAAGYDIGPDGVDGILGEDTHTAITAYQRDHGLAVDGIPGPVTLSSLRAQITTPTPHGDITALQRAVGADPDNVAGPDTRQRIDAVRRASTWGGVTFPYGVAYTQRVVGTYPDDVWGPHSMECHDLTVAAIQAAVGAAQDCVWGPETERLVVAALAAAEQA